MATTKKQFNVRLSSDALLAIKIRAKERGCSEAEVIEGWAQAGRPDLAQAIVEATTAQMDDLPKREPFPVPSIPVDEKRAMFEALKARMAGGGKLSDLTEPVRLLDSSGDPAKPRAPYDFNHPENGEPHRVTTIGKKLGLFYLGGGEPVFSRYLAEGEFELFWEARIK